MPTNKRKAQSAKRKSTTKNDIVSQMSVENKTNFQQYKSYAKSPKFVVAGVVVLLIVLAFIFKGLFVAAVVNGQPISRLSVISQLEKQNGKATLDQLVSQVLIEQEASKKNINVSQSDIDAQVSTIGSQLKSQGVTLDDALSQRGMTRADLNSQVKLQLLMEKLVGPISISDKQITDYVSANKDQMTGLTDAQMKDQAKQALQQQELNSKAQTLIAQLQKQAKINYFVNY